jgi:hypothetical protein
MNAKHKPAGYLHPNHKHAVSRRDLLAQGAISFGSYLAMPSLLSIFAQQARGAEELVCSAGPGGTRMVPMIIFDLAGGGNIAGTNVIVGGKGGQMDFLPDGSYATIGLAPEAEPQKLAATDLAFSEFGLAFHPTSKMLAGMREFTTAPTRAGTDGALFCAASSDDTRNNPHNPLYWIAKAGLGGELVSLVGTTDGTSGGRAAAPPLSIDPSKQPSRITRPEDALGLVDPGKLATILAAVSTPQQGIADVQKVLAATKTMSDAKLKMFQQKDLPGQIQDLVKCGYINSSDFLSKFSAAALDPRTDPIVTGRFAAIAGPVQAKAATIAKLVLDGYAGAGVIELGGYDYHGQGRATQDARDLEAGRMIGRVLEMAALKNQPVMIYVYTDGGVSATAAGAVNGIFPFASDSGERSAAFTLVYKPGGTRPAIRNGQRQIGAYKAGGSVDGAANKLSTSVEVLSKAVVANYLALHGKEGDLAKVVGDNPFGGELESYLAFSKLT